MMMMKIQKLRDIITSKLVILEGKIVACKSSGTAVDDAFIFISVFFLIDTSVVINVIGIVAVVMIEFIVCVLPAGLDLPSICCIVIIDSVVIFLVVLLVQ